MSGSQSKGFNYEYSTEMNGSIEMSDTESLIYGMESVGYLTEGLSGPSIDGNPSSESPDSQKCDFSSVSSGSLSLSESSQSLLNGKTRCRDEFFVRKVFFRKYAIITKHYICR